MLGGKNGGWSLVDRHSLREAESHLVSALGIVRAARSLPRDDATGVSQANRDLLRGEERRLLAALDSLDRELVES